MLYHNVRVAAVALPFIDSAAIVGMSLGTWALGVHRHAWPESTVEGAAVFAALNFVIFLLLAGRLRIYHARRTEAVGLEVSVLCEVALYAFGLSCMATQIFSSGLPGKAYASAILASIGTLIILRVTMRLLIRRLRRRGDDYRVWLIVGRNDRSADLAEEILRNPHFGINIAEVIDFAEGSGVATPKTDRFSQGELADISLRTLRSVEDVRELVATTVIDEVVVTLPLRTHYDTVCRVLEICCIAGISVRIRPQIFESVGYATEVSYVGRIPMLTHYNGPSSYGQLLVKRMIDVTGAGLGLLLLMPFFVVIAIIIKMGSSGPVLFRQWRVGLHGRHFQLVKFRSMVKDALQKREAIAGLNERDGKAFKIRNDARITPVGRWLRRYRLDELPQLWNVLVGDMSLVGPRPFPVTEATGFEHWHRRRHSMQPGLTCLWQIEDNPRMPLHNWMELDMAYIDRWSIWLDLKLIVRTVGTIMRGNGW